MVKRERMIVTGGRDFGVARHNATPERREDAKRERLFVVETLYRELRVRTVWAFDRLLVVVGDCPTGVDAITREAVKTWGLHVEVHEAHWKRLGRAAGPERNGRMVAAGAIRLLAFPGGNGTADCVRQARSKGITVMFAAPERESML